MTKKELLEFLEGEEAQVEDMIVGIYEGKMLYMGEEIKATKKRLQEMLHNLAAPELANL